MWINQFILGRQPLRRADLPRSPRLFFNRWTSTVVVVGKHATVFRYWLVWTVIRLVRNAALLATIGLGVCLLSNPQGDLNGLQMLRVRIDRAVIPQLPDSIAPTVTQGTILKDWVYAVFFFAVLATARTLQEINRDVISGFLLGRKTAIKFSKDAVTRYAFGFFPLTYRQSGDVKIQFRVTDDPSMSARNRPARYQPALFEMIVGSRRVAVAKMLGVPNAEEFVVVCTAALKFAGELASERERKRGQNRVATASGPIGALE